MDKHCEMVRRAKHQSLDPPPKAEAPQDGGDIPGPSAAEHIADDAADLQHGGDVVQNGVPMASLLLPAGDLPSQQTASEGEAGSPGGHQHGSHTAISPAERAGQRVMPVPELRRKTNPPKPAQMSSILTAQAALDEKRAAEAEKARQLEEKAEKAKMRAGKQAKRAEEQRQKAEEREKKKLAREEEAAGKRAERCSKGGSCRRQSSAGWHNQSNRQACGPGSGCGGGPIRPTAATHIGADPGEPRRARQQQLGRT